MVTPIASIILRGSSHVEGWKWEWFCNFKNKVTMDLIDILKIYFSTYIVHKKICANPQSSKDWFYKGRCPTISASRKKKKTIQLINLFFPIRTVNMCYYVMNHFKLKKIFFYCFVLTKKSEFEGRKWHFSLFVHDF